jgi:photosystem II stability/assembly factor-like uncharacterized protein
MNFNTLKPKIFPLVILIAGFMIYGLVSKDELKQTRQFKSRETPEAKETFDQEQEYYRNLYFPEGDMSPEQKYLLGEQIKNMPPEIDAITSWKLFGPSGFQVYSNQSMYWSGRATDIEVNGVPSIRVAGAGGGLWKSVLIFPVSIGDNIPGTQKMGSFCSNPSNPSIILAGTGENWFSGVSGAGLYMTTDEGATYTHITMTPQPGAFYKLRFGPGSSTIVHAGTSTGYFKSTNGGYNWTNYLGLKITDVAVNPSNTNIMYAAQWGDSLNGGIWKSTNAGLNWTRLTTGGIPFINVGRTSISIAPSSPAILYVNMSKWYDNTTMGVYKSTNAGSTWTNVTPVPSFHGGQGFHNCNSVVHPTNPNLVFVGGVQLFRSTNGGSSWTEVNVFHGDIQELQYTNNGSALYCCSDGGVGMTNDNGDTWNTSFNRYPITQHIGFDVSPNGNYCFTGTQDNGIIGTVNRGISWYMFAGGDGGYASILPNLNTTIFATENWSPGFTPIYSTDAGISWHQSINGIVVTSQGFTKIRNDNRAAPYLYHNNGNFVYRSTNIGASWSKLNTSAFPGDYVGDICVPTYNAASGPICYASVTNDPAQTTKIMRYVNGVWTNISAGIPASRNVTKVVSWDANNQVIYAVMSGTLSGEKIYKSTNRGGTWVNISGNMPNLVLTDLWPNPTNSAILYASTTLGCYRTTNTGVNWSKWTYGLPEAVDIREFNALDSTAQNGRYYLFAATHGCSIWYRNIAGDDPNGIKSYSSDVPTRFELMQNFPNPFNPSTKIHFSLPLSPEGGTRDVRMVVYNILGEVVETPVNMQLKAGNYEITWNGSKYSSGVYFYKLITDNFTETKKMLMIK